MEFDPSEKSIVINPITGKSMLGKYIFRNIILNNPKEDEIAYVNRMKNYYKDSGESGPLISNATSYERLKNSLNNTPTFKNSTRNILNIERARRLNKLSNSASALRPNHSPLSYPMHASVENPMKIEGEFKSNAIENSIRDIRNSRNTTNKRYKLNPQFAIQNRSNLINSTLIKEDTVDDSSFGRSLSKSDIDGASPRKFKHRYRKLFVDRQEIKGIFGEKPGAYHGFAADKLIGGTYDSSNNGIQMEPHFIKFKKEQEFGQYQINKSSEFNNNLPSFESLKANKNSRLLLNNHRSISPK